MATEDAGGAFARDGDHARLIEKIRFDFRATASMTGVREMSGPVASAMASVPRHRFVPPDSRAAAYANRPLSIGHGQTISQPFIVALMTELADIERGDRVLEIGTGSGYQAAVLAELGAEVY
ncbi:MAG: protein-L-isoaspartate O-methyltransferase, partial [Gammaproteobacteria bacterium]